MLPFHPYADLFPLIEGAEFAELAADIKANDLRERIVVWNGEILDGRNRYRAALAAGLLSEDDGWDRPKYFVKFVPDVDGDPLAYVLSKNIHRRHLTVGQRSYAMAEVERLRHGGQREQDANLRLDGVAPPPAETRAELAEKAHVSERSIASAATVRDHGVAELKEAVKRADISVSQAERIARLPFEQQPEAVARALPSGARAIMNSRQEPDDSLDFFPTPPFATRALIECVFAHIGLRSACRNSSAWDPACGEGHMAEPLSEYFRHVHASDVHDYGYGTVNDFLDPQNKIPLADWIITNPPFNDKGEAFVLKALSRARLGVAMFFRLQWLESVGRYERIFAKHPPRLIAQFAERVPLHKGRWEPDGTTATAYLWIVWLKQWSGTTEFFWIPPGQRQALMRPDDAERFTAHPVTKKSHLISEPAAPASSPDAAAVEPAVGTGSPAAGSLSSDDDLPACLDRRGELKARNS